MAAVKFRLNQNTQYAPTFANSRPIGNEVEWTLQFAFEKQTQLRELEAWNPQTNSWQSILHLGTLREAFYRVNNAGGIQPREVFKIKFKLPRFGKLM